LRELWGAIKAAIAFINIFSSPDPYHVVRVRAEDLGRQDSTAYVYVLPADSAGLVALYRFRLGDFPFYESPYEHPPFRPPLRGAPIREMGVAVLDSLTVGNYYGMAFVTRGIGPIPYVKESPGEIPHQKWMLVLIPVWSAFEIRADRETTEVTLKWTRWW
jgi:hypothetical protein